MTRYQAVCGCGASSEPVAHEVVAKDWADDHETFHALADDEYEATVRTLPTGGDGGKGT